MTIILIIVGIIIAVFTILFIIGHFFGEDGFDVEVKKYLSSVGLDFSQRNKMFDVQYGHHVGSVGIFIVNKMESNVFAGKDWYVYEKGKLKFGGCFSIAEIIGIDAALWPNFEYENGLKIYEYMDWLRKKGTKEIEQFERGYMDYFPDQLFDRAKSYYYHGDPIMKLKLTKDEKL